MSSPLTHTLYTDYCKARNIELDEEQFSSFMAFFPALMVAGADGIVDREEWVYCKKLAAGLGASFSQENNLQETENLTLIYRGEFRFLIKNMEAWEDRFLQALKEYFAETPYAKTFVSETLYLFADASMGISQEEMDLINYLEMKLALR